MRYGRKLNFLLAWQRVPSEVAVVSYVQQDTGFVTLSQYRLSRCINVPEFRYSIRGIHHELWSFLNNAFRSYSVLSNILYL